MANVIGEKNLVASIPEGLVDKFWATVPAGYKNKHVLAAAARIWISIPEDDRIAILAEERSGGNVKSLINKILDERLADFVLKSAQAESIADGEKRKKKRRSSKAG